MRNSLKIRPQSVPASDNETSSRILTTQIAGLPVIFHPLPERFLTKFVTDPITGCWNWTGCKKWQRYKAANGSIRVYNYAAFAVKATKPVIIKSAHRVAYEAYFGPIRQGLEPDHKCNNSLCVNPFHVEPVTHQVNCARRRKSGPYPTPGSVLWRRGYYVGRY